jgi:cytochrome d ubiquinol oxidase subunit I
MVSVGAALSGLWIIIANSWMQTPAGYEVQGDRAVLTDFLAAALNPSTLPRYLHTIAAAIAVGAFVMAGIAAWYLIRQRHQDVARLSLKLGLSVALLASVAMFVTGDTHSRQVADTQPVKFAAMNGLFDTQDGVPMIIFAFPPSQDGPSDLPALVIPNLVSLLTRFDANATIEGLKEFPRDTWPPVAATFTTYHLMVGLGTLMLLVMGLAVFAWWRGRLDRWRWLLGAVVLMTPAPLIAVQLGWATAEIGRQPWIVYGLMRTADGVSPIVSAPEVLLSLIGFGLVYLVLAALWLFLVRRALMTGPAPGPTVPDPAQPTEPVPALAPAEVPA